MYNMLARNGDECYVFHRQGMVWVVGDDEGAPVLLETVNLADPTFITRVVAIRVLPGKAKDTFLLQASRVGVTTAPIGYLYRNSNGDIAINPFPRNQFYYWSFTSKLVPSERPTTEWEVTLWNGIPSDWRHPTRVVDLRNEGAVTIVTTRELEDPGTATVVWSLVRSNSLTPTGTI
jgi:hypothetical protein